MGEKGKEIGEFFFFFKQKTAYGVLRSLVGSELCIRGRLSAAICCYLLISAAFC